jgi:glycosyltransferase involved in cell wall biosynthesis
MKISFVIPTKNCVVYLPHAIDSIMKQSHEDIELVIVNDGSSDTTADFLNKFTDDKKYPEGFELMKDRFKDNIKIIRTAGVGRGKARNLGNNECTGEIIFVLDADDYCSPDRVRKTLAKFKNGVEFVYGSAETMDFSGTKGKFIKADVINKDKALEKLKNEIVHSTVAYTKQLSKLYPYSEDSKISELGIDDWEQQIRLIKNDVKMDFVPTVLVAYRILESSISQNRNESEVESFKKKYLETICV